MTEKNRNLSKRIRCFTEEQQAYYDGLNDSQKKYIDYRGRGYTRPRAYLLAGYRSKDPSQAAYNLEKKQRGLKELIDALLNTNKVKALLNADKNEALTKQVDALAMQDGAENAIRVIEGADSETAKRIQFYRDISAGKIKTIKKTVKKNARGEVVSTVIEEVSDISSRINARKELDRILGLNSVIDIDKFSVGDITINIVDASKKEELEDTRNRVCLNPEEVEIVDGEPAVVVETEEKVEPNAKNADNEEPVDEKDEE